MKRTAALLPLILAGPGLVLCQTVPDTLPGPAGTAHFQFTAIAQGHPPFRSPYSGRNSLGSAGQWGATSITSTLFLGRRLWKGAAIYFNPELSGGMGLSGALGVAGGLNGETYRVSDPAPQIYVARGYLQQHIGLGRPAREELADDVDQVHQVVPAERITISAGRFSLSDFFDDNAYAHDPRTQFLNWALMANGAWDYPANARGYNYGVVVELFRGPWAVHLSSSAVPELANGSIMEYDLMHANGESAQVDRSFKVNGRAGMLRLLYARMNTRAPSYRNGIEALALADTALLDQFEGLSRPSRHGGRKTTIGFSGDLDLGGGAGVFLRAGWNDGQYSTWAFTEIDQTLTGGLSLKGTRWKRPDDAVGLAIGANGISGPHRDFLSRGGNGFILGDGALNYREELIVEAYYSALLTPFFQITLDYQYMQNPGYNADRGPVHALAVRGHVSF